jgi:phage-related minor tail protein
VAQDLTIRLNADGSLVVAAAKQVDAALDGIGQSASTAAAKTKAMGDAAAASFQKTEISAKQTAAAMRNLPAQFTDIFVSLQGGQAPMTVLFQQGGQIKDMFGGVGNAARAMGGYVLGMINPLTAAAAALGAVGLAYYQGSKEADAFRAALINTGNAAGTSASEMAGLASTMDASFGQTIGQSAEALAAMAATGQVGRASLQQFAQAAIDMEKTTGQSIEATAKIFADLGREPVTASANLNKSLNYLTASTYAQIKAAADLGETEKAAALAQEAYAKAMDGRTNNMVQNLGYIEGAWKGVKNIARETWDAMLNVGRANTTADQIQDIRKELDLYDKGLRNLSDRQVQAYKIQLDGLQEVERMQKRAGLAASERAATEKAGIAAIDAVAKANQGTLTKQEQMNKELADYRKHLQALPAEQRQSAEQIAKVEAAIRDKYKPKGSSASASTVGESELAGVIAKTKANADYLTGLQTLGAAAEKQTTTELALAKVTEELAGKIAGVARANKLRVQSELEKQVEQEKLIATEQDNLKILEESAKANQAAMDAAYKRTDALSAQVEKEREAVAAIGLNKEELAELQAAKYEDAAASKDRQAVLAEDIDWSGQLSAAYRKEAEDLRKLAALKRQGAGKEAAIESEKIAKRAADKAASDWQRAADKAASDWQRAADKMQDSITDALMRGFESGKSFAMVLRDTVVNMFKSMVLRPVIQGVVGGAMGMGATAAGASGIEGLINGAVTSGMGSLIGGLALGGSSLAAIGSSIGTGFMATIGGGSVGAAAGAYTAAGMTGVAGGLSAGATAAMAVPYVGAAVAALNALGAFRSTKNVGGGITGTLGGDDLQAYDLNRRGGSLFSGPSYSVRNERETEQTQAINGAFLAIRTSTAQMAKDLGLSTSAVDKFTMSVGDVKVHPDIDRLGLVLDGLTDQQKLAKIEETLQKSGNAMAELVLGAGATAQQLSQLYAGVMQQRAGLELQLLQAQGNVAAIRERERNALHESNRAIYDQITALQDQKTATQAAAQAQQAAAQAQQAAAQAAAAIAQQQAGLQDELDQMLGNTAALRARERAALDESNRAIYDQIQALQDQKTATDQAWALVERSADAERNAVQSRIDAASQSVSALQAVFNLLKTSAADLYGQVSSTAGAGAAAGRDYIANALSAAQKTGYLPDQEGLQDAISAVRADMDSRTYASAFDADRDRLVLAGQLSQLKDISGEQLTGAERMLRLAQLQLAGIDAQVALAGQQLSATQGVGSAVVSLSAAITNLTAARAATSGGGAASGSMGGGAVTGGATSGASLKDLAAALYGSVTTGYDTNKFNQAVNAYGGAQKAFAMLGWDGSRASAASIASAYGVVPKFAAGGLHSGGLRLVGEKGPELEVTGPARYYTAQDTQDMLSGGGSGQAAEIRALREELAAQSRALVQSQTRMNRLFERWDGEGLPAARSTT